MVKEKGIEFLGIVVVNGIFIWRIGILLIICLERIIVV